VARQEGRYERSDQSGDHPAYQAQRRLRAQSLSGQRWGLDHRLRPYRARCHRRPEDHPGTREDLLRQDLKTFQDGVDDFLEGDTSDNQFGAMVSLAFNIGLGNFRKSSVLRDHNASNPKAASDAFLMWDKAGGRVLAGLERRRQEERALYLTPDLG